MRVQMGKGRLEAFSDGVLAIIITIMVLELKVPHGNDLAALQPLLPVFISYLLSFMYIGIYWNNHHHLMHLVERVSGGVLWANLHLLFWLSLIPFSTGWMGEHSFAVWPVVLYGVNLLFAGFAYYILSRVLIVAHGKNSELARAVGRDTKGPLSLILYSAAVTLAFWNPWVSLILYGLVAAIWLIPDRRIENRISR